MHVIVFRFSAFGDVALTVPVIRGVLYKNPDLHITFVSDLRFRSFFHAIPRLNFYGIELKNYKGLPGLIKLYLEINSAQKWDIVIDLHSVLRTWVLDGLFRISGIKVYEIDKGRKAKKELTRKSGKVFKPLKHTTERYLDVFRQAGIPTDANFDCPIRYNPEFTKNIKTFYAENDLDKKEHWIAVAPFSIHKEKQWPVKKMEELIGILAERNNYKIFLFGAGPVEEPKLEALSEKFDNTYNLAGRLNMEEEIVLLRDIDLMISMDSFNMHLAALCNVKVVSVWGATHPHSGFGPVNNNEKYIVQIPQHELNCRPCSVFGNKPCYRGDHACMRWISVNQVLDQVKKALADQADSP